MRSFAEERAELCSIRMYQHLLSALTISTGSRAFGADQAAFRQQAGPENKPAISGLGTCRGNILSRKDAIDTDAPCP